MIYTKEEKLLKNFIKLRTELIEKLEAKSIDKQEFIIKNYEYFIRIAAKPFIKVDNIEKGIFNYQYYNSIAKFYVLEKKLTSKFNRKKILSLEHKINDMYDKKNQSILSCINIINYKNIDAYYIESSSNKLKNLLYEIVLLDYKYAIFHSTSSFIIQKLNENGIIVKSLQRSLIEDYINTKYWGSEPLFCLLFYLFLL